MITLSSDAPTTRELLWIYHIAVCGSSCNRAFLRIAYKDRANKYPNTANSIALSSNSMSLTVKRHKDWK